MACTLASHARKNQSLLLYTSLRKHVVPLDHYAYKGNALNSQTSGLLPIQSISRLDSHTSPNSTTTVRISSEISDRSPSDLSARSAEDRCTQMTLKICVIGDMRHAKPDRWTVLTNPPARRLTPGPTTQLARGLDGRQLGTHAGELVWIALALFVYV